MRKSIIFAVLAAIATAGCKNSSNFDEPPAPDRSLDGHYIITPTPVYGDCGQPEDLVLVVWNGVVADDGIHGYMIEGELSGNHISGVGLDENEESFSFYGNIGKFGVVTGEFHHESCEGWLKGSKIL